MLLKIFNFYKSESFWRYVDAFSPRLFALVTHTLVIAVYGKELYGAVAWLVAAYGIWVSLVPDPHSFLLVRSSGARAQRLGRLMIPTVIAKAIFCGGALWVTALLLMSPELSRAIGNQGKALMIGTIAYGASEFIWTVAATASFAADRLKKMAVKGVTSRIIGLGLAITCFKLYHPDFGVLLFLYAIPTLGTVLNEFRPSLRARRIFVCYIFSLKNYALMSQALGLTTTILTQILPTGAGMLQGVSAQEVGELTYVTRVLSALVTPFQVLQNIVVKAYVQAGRIVTPSVYRYKMMFMIGGALTFTIFTTALMLATYKGKVAPQSFVALLVYGACSSVFTWQRYTLSLLTAGASIRDVFYKIYLPVCAACCVSSVPAGYYFGVYGIALTSGFSWCAIGLIALKYHSTVSEPHPQST